MTHTITALCLRDTACVDVCPVECIIPGKPESEWPWLYIDPDTCIDCGACVPECPYEAIFPEDEVPTAYTMKDGQYLADTKANLPDGEAAGRRCGRAQRSRSRTPRRPARALSSISPRPHRSTRLSSRKAPATAPRAKQYRILWSERGQRNISLASSCLNCSNYAMSRCVPYSVMPTPTCFTPCSPQYGGGVPGERESTCPVSVNRHPGCPTCRVRASPGAGHAGAKALGHDIGTVGKLGCLLSASGTIFTAIILPRGET